MGGHGFVSFKISALGSVQGVTDHMVPAFLYMDIWRFALLSVSKAGLIGRRGALGVHMDVKMAETTPTGMISCNDRLKRGIVLVFVMKQSHEEHRIEEVVRISPSDCSILENLIIFCVLVQAYNITSMQGGLFKMK